MIAVGGSVCRRRAEREEAAEITEQRRRIVLEGLRNRRLHQAQGHAGHIAGMPVRQAIGAPARRQRDQQNSRPRAQRPAPAGEIAEPRRQTRDQHRQQAQPVDADERRELQHRERAGKRARPGIADEVPGKAGEDVAAQPFGAAPAQRRAPARVPCRRAATMRQSAWLAASAAPVKIASPAGTPATANGTSHQNWRDIDEERRRDPIESGDEKAEAEAPAESEGRLSPVLPSLSQTRPGNEISSTGVISTGGSDAAASAPSSSAARWRRQPRQAREPQRRPLQRRDRPGAAAQFQRGRFSHVRRVAIAGFRAGRARAAASPGADRHRALRTRSRADGARSRRAPARARPARRRGRPAS